MGKSSFNRKNRIRRLGRTFLIVCEGIRTEPIYFDAIRSSLRRSTIQIKVLHPSATDPKSIVEATIREVKKLKSEGLWFDRDFVCSVFDGDEHRIANPGNWRRAIELAETNGIHLAISNPSFELWYLLHFADQRANIDRGRTIQRLRTYIPTYDKSLDVYSIIASSAAVAISRAKGLRMQNERNGSDKYTNPCTFVDTVVEELLKLGKRN